MSEDGKGLNGVIAEIERSIVIGNKRLADMRGAAMTREYGFQEGRVTGLGAARSALTALRDAIQARLRVAENSVAAHGCATEAPAAVRELSWVLGTEKRKEEAS